MNSVYGDHLLARMIAQERIQYRERITLTLGWHPFKNLIKNIRGFVDGIVGDMEEPAFAPVFCREFAPGC
jgi:hypothetical protein